MKKLHELYREIDNKDLTLLLVRLGLGIILIMHGIAKISSGVGHVQQMLIGIGFPDYIANNFAYLVYVGEVLAPIMLILGLYSRISSIIILANCIIILLVKNSAIFAVDPNTGGFILSEVYLYVFCALAIFFGGGGKYAIKKD